MMMELRLEVESLPGAQFVTELPEGQRCVGIIEFRGRVLVATDRQVLELKGDRLVALEFELEP